MMRNIIFIIAIAISIACTTHPQFIYNKPIQFQKVVRDIPIWVDRLFTQEQQDSIDRAIEMWNWSLNGQVVLHVVDKQFDMEIDKIKARSANGGYLILRITSDNPRVHDSKGQKTLGFANRIGGEWLFLIIDRLEPKDVEPVAAHELGHLFGINHGGAGLMRARYTSDGTWSCVDVYSATEAEEVFGLPLGSTAWCSRAK